MASIPHELIRDVQIRTRAAVGLPDYDPCDPTLPSLPSISAEVSAIDPSPAGLHCENCKGPLLRGTESLICVYCGRIPQYDAVREPMCFNSTVGYTWLLRSLGLDGSEMVEPHKSKNEQDQGQNSPRPPMLPLSESLNFKIPWPVSGKTVDGSQSPLSFDGVPLDDFFVKSKVEAVLSDVSMGQKFAQSQIETSDYNNIVPRDSQSLNVQSFEADKFFFKDETGDTFSQWEADFQSADTNKNRSSFNNSGNRSQDSLPFNPSMDIEQLRYNTENVVSEISMGQNAKHDLVGTSGNKDISPHDGYDSLQNVQSFDERGSFKKEDTGEDFSEWDADFQSAESDQKDVDFKSSQHETGSLADSENQFPDSKPFNNSTVLEDEFAAKIDSVFGPGKDPDDDKVKDTTVASPAFDEWKSDELWSNLSSKNSRTVGELNATISNKNNHMDHDTYKSSHDSSANSDLFKDFQWQNKGTDVIVDKSTSEKHEKMDEDLFGGWGNLTGLASLEVSSVAKNAEIADDKTKDEQHKTIDEDSLDEWGGFAESSLSTSSDANIVGFRESTTHNGEYKTTDENLFDGWGNFSSVNIETENADMTKIKTKDDIYRSMDEEPFERWGDFTASASLQDSSETKDGNTTVYKTQSEEHKKTDDDLFEGWGNLSSSTSLHVSSETNNANMAGSKKNDEEHGKMDEDLFEGWGNFTSSTSLQISTENKSGDITESKTKNEENKKVDDDYSFEDWGYFNKPKEVPLKPIDDASFEGWSDFTGTTNIHVSSDTNLNPSDEQASTSDQKSSEMDFFNWDNRSQGSGFSQANFFSTSTSKNDIVPEGNTTLSENPATDWLNGTDFLSKSAAKGDDSLEKSNQDKDDVKMLISQMHDLSFMLADDLCIPSSSNTHTSSTRD